MVIRRVSILGDGELFSIVHVGRSILTLRDGAFTDVSDFEMSFAFLILACELSISDVRVSFLVSVVHKISPSWQLSKTAPIYVSAADASTFFKYFVFYVIGSLKNRNASF